MRKFVRHHLRQNVGDINHISNVSYILIIIIYYCKLVVVVVVVVCVWMHPHEKHENLRKFEIC